MKRVDRHDDRSAVYAAGDVAWSGTRWHTAAAVSSRGNHGTSGEGRVARGRLVGRATNPKW